VRWSHVDYAARGAKYQENGGYIHCYSRHLGSVLALPFLRLCCPVTLGLSWDDILPVPVGKSASLQRFGVDDVDDRNMMQLLWHLMQTHYI